MSEKTKVTALKPRDVERIVLNERQLPLVRDAHERLMEVAVKWSQMLVLLGVDETRLISMDFDQGHFTLKPLPQEPEGS